MLHNSSPADDVLIYPHPKARARIAVLLLCWLGQLSAADFHDPHADREALPRVPPGFEISFFAREPLVRQPCSMAFDAQGRLCVGMGPQYRHPKPDTPGDSVVLVLDRDGDGAADTAKVFATGFNAIQGLAWHGRDLWVANAPDLTVVRDLDGDDTADEYVRVYTDLGNLEHGLHGLNWAPDGRLYMSKGNSKGLTQPGRVAPKPFRDLWGVTAPPGTPDFPPPRTFKRDEYRKAYQDPDDDWGREGGVLRCDDGGGNLEIVSRGFRNPWDIAFDSGFNWLGTDNDQTSGDRVFMPFFGAHFGWNHPWSAHWSDELHPPSAPVSGPLFEGSGTGVVFADAPEFPPTHRGIFFINDWLRKTTFLWRPQWEGALLRPAGGGWGPFVEGGPSLFRPTDLEVGPDGALWILGWSSGYGADYKAGEMVSEGRVFRVTARGKTPASWRTPKRSKALERWTVEELVEDFDGPLPVWRSNAQDELVRRGGSVKTNLFALLQAGGLSQARQTWTAWTLGRMDPADEGIEAFFVKVLSASPASPAGERGSGFAPSLNLGVQSIRILAHRARFRGGGQVLPPTVTTFLKHPEPRLRFEAVQAIGQTRPVSSVAVVLDLLAEEKDLTVFYAGWQALRATTIPTNLKPLLKDARAGVRRAVLLALLEDHALSEPEVQSLAGDVDPGVRDLAGLWLRKAAGGGETVVVRGRPLAPSKTSEAGPRMGPPAALVRDVQARSGASYRVVPGGLLPGAKIYSDRRYDFRRVPPELLELDFIQTANEDDGSLGEAWLTFEALMPVRVHVAFDTRARVVPQWLLRNFAQSNLQIRADHWMFQIYSKEFPAGRIELGGNTEDGRPGGKGNYIVILEALPLMAPAAATSLEATLSTLTHGNRDRGQWLFHARGGAGCFNCHRLEGHGNAFGPDLAGLGERATARHIVQSILEPNAIITEGFNLQSVMTADAEVSGILIEESGLSLTLGLATGERQVIPKAKISSRKTGTVSAMPAYDTVLTTRHAADLATYLLAQRNPREGGTGGGERGPAEGSGGSEQKVLPVGGQTGGFRVEQNPDRLQITFSNQPVAEFVFGDEKILRPYFANVHAPGGIKVTRNHPPLAGVDALDHDTMHPGIWLAFGDISGADLWRNKGRMEHVRFVGTPGVRDGRLTFATENRLRTSSGQAICSLTNHFTLTRQSNAWWIVWEAIFRSDDGDFVFGDQEEMGFGARVATAITEQNGGVITSSLGIKSAKGTWGREAAWCDYSGVAEGRHIGITLMADPANFRPSWWHNRDYGVFVANPFGRAAMKQGSTSAVTVQRGKQFQLRFAAVVHEGPGYEPANTFQTIFSARSRSQ